MNTVVNKIVNNKYMNDKIQKIIDDLYEIDRSLQKYEPEIIKIIEKLLVSRPDTKFDKKFVQTLRAEVMERAGQIKKHMEATSPRKLSFNFDFMNIKKLYYVGAGAVICLLIAIPVFYKLNKDEVMLFKSGAVFESSFTKIALGDGAFGSLKSQEAGVGALESLGTGADAAFVQAVPSEKAIGAGGGMGVLPQERVSYKYVYKGEEFDLSEAVDMEVLKRVKDTRALGKMDKLLGSIDFELFDVGSFEDLKLKNFSMAEDRDYGYYINVNLDEKTININENWVKWPRGIVEQLTLDDMPNDEQLIKIASKFLREHKINTEFYGEPEVWGDWKDFYAQSEYMPDSVSIVYPLKIGGKIVYDVGGNKQGLMVRVSIRYNRVVGVSGLNTQMYEGSKYALETDLEKILQIAEKGGSAWGPVFGEDTLRPGSGPSAVELELGEPVVSYVQHWKHDGYTSEELLAPAVIFPVINNEPGLWNMRGVVVPLVKELLEENGNISAPVMERTR